MSIQKPSVRNKSIFKLYKKTKNMASVAREFNLSRERVRQLVNKYGVHIDKKGSQGKRKLSTVA